MALRRGFPARSLPRSKRKMAWTFGPDSISQSLITTGNNLWTTGVQLVGESNATIVRIRGEMLVRLKAVAGIDDGYQFAIGLGLVTLQAFNAGTASIPGPVSEADWEGWMFHRFGSLHVNSATLGATENIGLLEQRIEIDTKAMRIFRENMVLMGALEGVEVGTSVLEFNADTRVLLKLS